MADRDKDRDNRQGPLTRVLQKHAGRAKERLLQNLGKADRTTDVDFDLCVKNFNKQLTAVSRLQKEFKNYHQCLRAMQASRKSLMDTVCELYEPCWVGLDQFLIKSEVLNQNFDDFCEKINNLLLTPVASYIAQFPELNNKISKRNRKLLDYDNCRHNVQNLETMKKREEAKITKAKEQLDEARNLFEVINSELHDELPALYDSRVSFFVSHLQCLYLAEAQFHNQDSAILLELNGILEFLDEASKKNGIDKVKLPSIESHMDEPENYETEKTSNRNSITEKEDGSSSGSASGSAIFSTPPTGATRNCQLESQSDTNTIDVFNEETKPEEIGINAPPPDCHPTNSPPPKTVPTPTADIKFSYLESKPEEIGSGDVPPSDCNPPNSSPPKTVPIPTADYRFLYRVQGTFKYSAEDVDELSFNVGDIIDVVAYDDPEEQEEGWLMGVFNGKKGLFPANFTSRI